MIQTPPPQASTAALQAEWSSLSQDQQQAAWERFTQEIDEGAAGWNRFRPILWPAYQQGLPIFSTAAE